MSELDLIAQTRWVLGLTACVGLVFGAIMQRTGFCTMGAVTDILSVHDWTRLRQWSLAIATSLLGAGLLAQTGTVDLSKTLYVAPRLNVLSVLAGSVLFGVGMVLAAGCSSKTLVRMGEGNLKSLVVFLVLGLSAWMTLKGVFGVLRVNTLDAVSVQLPAGQDLPRLWQHAFGGELPAVQLGLAAVAALVFAAFALMRSDFRTPANLLAGFGIGLCSVALFYVSGHVGYVTEDPNTLEEAFLATGSGRLEGLSFVAPYSQVIEWLVFFSDASRKLTVGIVLVPAVVLGSCLSAVLTRTFHWQGFASNEELANHLVGGMLMGFGGVTALGCTVGQGLTGLSTLAVGSLLALPGFIVGGLAGMKYLSWRSLPAPCVPLKYTKKDDEPLDLQRHNDTFSTAAQLTLGDLSEVARMGFKSVINNRPDYEGGADQPPSVEVERACQSLGLRYAYLPVVSGRLTPEEAVTMAKLLEDMPHPVLAFCRSGTRSTQLYQMARHIG
jgi:uncharacterized protein (TIGR01244 family)